MKIALIVGHNEKSKGAYSNGLGYSEFDLYNEVADSVIEKFDGSGLILEKIIRKQNTGYSKEMAEVVEKVNNGKFDIAIELHFNAANGQANGTTVLYWYKSKKGLELANLFQAIMSEKTGVKKRDLIPVKSSAQNGAYGIMHSKPPYILIEPFFGDSKVDTEKVSVDILSDVLASFLEDVSGVSPVSNNDGNKLNSIADSLIAIAKRLKELAK